ncbi:MAG: DUF4190 domain-containing protein [Actinomycetota bacterium]
MAALVCGIAQFIAGPFASIPAIALGHMAHNQLRKTGESGRGMALAGLLLGYIGTVVWLIIAAALIYLVVVLHNTPYHTAIGAGCLPARPCQA